MQFHPNGKNNAIIWADNAAHLAHMGSQDSPLFHEQEMNAWKTCWIVFNY